MTLKNQNLGTLAQVIFAGKNLGCLYSIGDYKLSKNDIDITCYGSTFRKYTGGLASGGSIDLEIGNGSEAVIQMLDAFMDGTEAKLKLISPDGGQMECDAYVSSYGNSYKIDDVLRTSVTFTLSGAPKFTPPLLISPRKVTLKYGKTQQFTANYDVDWDIYDPSVGTSTIDNSGLFTLTSTDYVSEVIIRATARQNGDLAYAVVTVETENVIIDPIRAVLKPGESQQFTANVPVKWEIQTPNVNKNTTISNDGILLIDRSETVKSIIIKATSAYNEYDTSLISIFIIKPVEVEVIPGDMVQFISSIPVVWSIARGTPTSLQTMIDVNTGLFTYDNDERTPEFMICAIETVSGTQKSAYATVAIKNIPVVITPSYTVSCIDTDVQLKSNIPVTWSIITKNIAKNTHINEDGLLHISHEELNDVLIIQGESVYHQIAKSTVQLLRITPSYITLMRGGDQQFTANMPVVWSIDSELSDKQTKITENGHFTFGYNELAYEVKIVATLESGVRAYAIAELAEVPLMISPHDVDVSAGTRYQFTANLPATWEISDITMSTDTHINPSTGELYVGLDETISSIRITAISGRGAKTTALAYPVNVIPRFAKVEPNVQYKFDAPNRTRIYWSISSDHDESTMISNDGIFIYDKNETNPRINVRASAVRNPDMYYDAIASIDHLPVTVTPSEIVLAPEYPVDFVCNVPCVWKIETKDVEDGTIIDEKTGHFIIDADERVEQIVISAKSYYNKFGLAAIRTLLIVPYEQTMKVGTSKYLRCTVDDVKWSIISTGHTENTRINSTTGELTIDKYEIKSIILVSATYLVDDAMVATGIINVEGIEFHILPELTIISAGNSQLYNVSGGVKSWDITEHDSDTTLETFEDHAILHVAKTENHNNITIKAISGQGMIASAEAVIFWLDIYDVWIKAGESVTINASTTCDWEIVGDVEEGTYLDINIPFGNSVTLIIDLNETNPSFTLNAIELISGVRNILTVNIHMDTVIIEPKECILAPYDNQQFTSNRVIDKWEIIEEHDDATTCVNGLLHISNTEKARLLTIRAIVDENLYVDAKVTIYHIEPKYHIIKLGGECIFNSNIPTIWSLTSSTTGETWIRDGVFHCGDTESAREFTIKCTASENREANITVNVYINTITIIPTDAIVTPLDKLRLTSVPQNVNWSLDGSYQPETQIDNAGLLSIDLNETQESILVRANTSYASGQVIVKLFSIIENKFTILRESIKQLHHTLAVSSIKWQLNGQYDKDTLINELDGVLQVSKTEAKTEINIMCTGVIDGKSYVAYAVGMINEFIITPDIAIAKTHEELHFSTEGAGSEGIWEIVTLSSTSTITNDGIFTLSDTEPNNIIEISCTRKGIGTAYARIYKFVLTPNVALCNTGGDITFISTIPVSLDIVSFVDMGTIIDGMTLHVADIESHEYIKITATEVITLKKETQSSIIYIAKEIIDINPINYAISTGKSVQLTASKPITLWEILTLNSHATIDNSGLLTMHNAEDADHQIIVMGTGEKSLQRGITIIYPYVIFNKIVSIGCGDTFQFSTRPSSILWSISGQTSIHTSINEKTGEFICGNDEGNDEIIVTATPALGDNITATVYVSDTHLSIKPAESHINRGETQKLYTVGGIADSWEISDETKPSDIETTLTINSDGHATFHMGLKEGYDKFIIVATISGETARAVVYNNNPTLIIIPNIVDINPGGDYQFTTNFPNAQIGWLLTGQTEENSQINQTGYVILDDKEHAKDITVVAWMRQDPMVNTTARINVLGDNYYIDKDHIYMTLTDSEIFNMILIAGRNSIEPNITSGSLNDIIDFNYII